MASVASRDLRNHTADVLRRVEAGEKVTITVNGRAVAEIVPIESQRPSGFTRSELIHLMTHHQADPGLRADLAELAGDTTDDLGPIDQW